MKDLSEKLKFTGKPRTKSHKNNFLLCILLLVFSVNSIYAQSKAGNRKKEKNIANDKVYYEHGKYGGWPANWGIWSWNEEILVGFTHADHKGGGVKSYMRYVQVAQKQINQVAFVPKGQRIQNIQEWS